MISQLAAVAAAPAPAAVWMEYLVWGQADAFFALCVNKGSWNRWVWHRRSANVQRRGQGALLQDGVTLEASDSDQLFTPAPISLEVLG